MSNFSKFVRPSYNGVSMEHRLGFYVVVDRCADMVTYFVRFSYMATFTKLMLRKYSGCSVSAVDVGFFDFPIDVMYYEQLPF